MISGEGYKITKGNVLCHTLVGLQTSVVKGEESRSGIKGKIIKETKNTLVVETKKGEKIVPKKETVFKLNLGKEKVLLDGKKICLREEERLKENWRKCT